MFKKNTLRSVPEEKKVTESEYLPLPTSKPKLIVSNARVIEFASSQSQEQEKKEEKQRNLSPETLAQLLIAEVDHFLTVEQEIAEFAGVENNLLIAAHEQKLATDSDIKEENLRDLKILSELDAEIMRLESEIAKKMQSR